MTNKGFWIQEYGLKSMDYGLWSMDYKRTLRKTIQKLDIIYNP